MARITRKSIQTVKDTVKISSVFERLGARVVPQGSSMMAFCPFCEDANSKSPACSLDDSLGLYHCFRCSSGGDTIGAVQQHEDCSFPEAVEWLAMEFNIPLEYEESSNPEAESHRKMLVNVLEAAQEEFLNQRSDPHFNDFLISRNISQDDADRFGLGISLYTEADAVVSRLTEKFDVQALVDAGLCFINDDGQAVLRFKNRIMFPIRTVSGTLVGFGGRDLTGRAPAKYKNSPESQLFKKRSVLYGMDTAKRAMSKSKKVIVCEGYMDTLALQCHGFDYAVGAMGTALTPYNLKRLSTFADTIYLSLDSDSAGIAAATRTADTIPEGFDTEIRVLMIPEVECHNEEEVRATSLAKADEYLWKDDDKTIPVDYPVMVPLAKDPDEFFNQVGHSPEEFEEIMHDSKDLFLFCSMNILKPYVAKISALDDNAQIGREKQRAKEEINRFVSRIYNKTNIYQRRNIASYLVKTLRLVESEDTLETEWLRSARGNASSTSTNTVSQQPTFKSAATKEEDLVIATLYFVPTSRTVIYENIGDVESVFTSPIRKSIFKKIDEAYSTGLDAKAAGDTMDENETRELSRIIMGMEQKTRDSLDDFTITLICRKAKLHSIENQIDAESGAANPDVMKIIDLKMQLAALQSEEKSKPAVAGEDILF